MVSFFCLTVYILWWELWWECSRGWEQVTTVHKSADKAGRKLQLFTNLQTRLGASYNCSQICRQGWAQVTTVHKSADNCTIHKHNHDQYTSEQIVSKHDQQTTRLCSRKMIYAAKLKQLTPRQCWRFCVDTWTCQHVLTKTDVMRAKLCSFVNTLWD